MTRIAYHDGRWLPIAAPAVPVEDRGLQFADAVYEVLKAVDGRPLDLDRHLARLDRSLRELRMAWPVTPAVLRGLVTQALARNGLREATVYLQVGRGVAPRYHLFPKMARPTLTITVRRASFPSRREIEGGVRVVTMPDPRWARCDIKSVGLLPNVLCRQAAAEAGCREAWLVDGDGLVTEGSGSNAYIVDAEGRLVTRPLGPEILGGVTRSVVLETARAAGIEVVERPFSVDEAHAAREALLSSTTSLLLPVVAIDGRPVANGAPGEIGRRLLRAYAEREGLPSRLWP
ncbi:MAG: D-amino-acid transaminase [Geminicoccaceae bacterium]